MSGRTVPHKSVRQSLEGTDGLLCRPTVNKLVLGLRERYRFIQPSANTHRLAALDADAVGEKWVPMTKVS